MSVNLDALADEVFDAAAAQARGAALVERLDFGEVRRSPDYPDLFFLNGINDLVAPGWTVEQLQSVILEHLPRARQLRVSSRDRDTIAQLGPRLEQAGYQAECRVAMVQVVPVEPAEKRLQEIRPVRSGEDWRAFEALIHRDTAEHSWSAAMTEQLVRLYRQEVNPGTQSWLLGFAGGDAVAHLGTFQHGAVAYLHALYTDPRWRRRGAGSALIVEASRLSRDGGCQRVTLQCTRDSFLPAFYHRLGFRAVGENWIWSRTGAP